MFTGFLIASKKEKFAFFYLPFADRAASILIVTMLTGCLMFVGDSASAFDEHEGHKGL